MIPGAELPGVPGVAHLATLCLDFRPAVLKMNKWILFAAAQVAVICYA